MLLGAAVLKNLVIIALAILISTEAWLYQSVEIPKVHVQPYTAEYLSASVIAEQRQKETNRAIEVSAHMYHNYNCSSALAGPTVKYASLHNLPVRLVTAVVIVESSCLDSATSKAGATGLMQ